MSNTRKVTIWVCSTYYERDVGSMVALTEDEIWEKALDWAEDDLPDTNDIRAEFNAFVDAKDYSGALEYWAYWVDENGTLSYLNVQKHTLTVPASSTDWWDVWLGK